MVGRLRSIAIKPLLVRDRFTEIYKNIANANAAIEINLTRYERLYEPFLLSNFFGRNIKLNFKKLEENLKTKDAPNM